MYYFAEKIERSSEIGRIVGAVNLVKEFERNIFRELDMFTEAGSIERFAANFKDAEDLYIPNVYWDYTSRSVLTMEHIDGIKMDQVEEIKAHGIDPKEIAMIGLRSFSRQLMDFGLFHADPHPGNTIVMYDGRVSLVDFGIIGYLAKNPLTGVAPRTASQTVAPAPTPPAPSTDLQEPAPKPQAASSDAALTAAEERPDRTRKPDPLHAPRRPGDRGRAGTRRTVAPC